MVVITIKALGHERDEGENVGAIAWRPLIFIVGANLVFGGLLAGVPAIGLPPMGLAIAIVALVFLSSFAGQEFNVRDVAILSLVLAVGSYLVFIILLKLPVSVWPTLAGN